MGRTLRGRGLCRVVVALCVSGWAGAVLTAQQGVSTYEKIAVGATAVGLATTTTNPTGRQMNTCTARVETASVRFRDDGTNPTSDVGYLLDDDNVLEISTNAIARAIRFISTTSTTAVVNVRCYP